MRFNEKDMEIKARFLTEDILKAEDPSGTLDELLDEELGGES